MRTCFGGREIDTLNELAQLGIATEWWVTLRDVPPVRSAIIRAFLTHWLPVVEGAIQSNKKLGKQPSTWDQLAAAMDRNFASLWRAKSGKVTVSWYDANLMAETLNLRIEQLTPTRLGQCMLRLNLISALPHRSRPANFAKKSFSIAN